MMRANVKPLTHWVIYKGYRVRFLHRAPEKVTGVLTMSDGTRLNFHYDPVGQVLHLPDRQVILNEFGWEVPACSQEPKDRRP